MLKNVLSFAALGLLSLASADAQTLVDHYNLNGNGTDSVNAANSGTLNGNATFTTQAGTGNGLLTSSGTDNTSYLNLPATVGSGLTGNFSIQDFVSTTSTTSNYSTLFSFATSQSNFILFNASRPNNGGAATTGDFQQAPSTPNEIDVNAGGTNVFGTSGAEIDIVMTYISSTGAVSIYSNGALFGSGNIGAGFSFAAASAGGSNGINGHSPYGADNTLAGSTDDLRLYSGALTAAQVTALNTAGPNATNAAITSAIPEPSTWMAAVAGIVMLCGLQRFRRSAV